MRAKSRTSAKRRETTAAAWKRTEEGMRARLRAVDPILESLADGVLVVDREHRPVLLNTAAERVLGLGHSEVPPAEWSKAYGLFLPDMLTPYPYEDLPLTRALCGQSVTGVEMFVRNARVPEGAWFSVTGTPWRDAAGSLCGGIVVFREVTAHKRTHDEVARLASALEQTADGVVITNERGEILFVNRGFEQITGFTRAEVIGRTPAILKSGRHDAAFYRTMWSTLLRGEVFRSTLVNRKKSGETYQAEQTITPMKDPAGNVTSFVSVAKDVTELRKAQERETEMCLAAQVQQRLYPRCAPRFAGVDVAGAALPSTLTCGDYFDYLLMPEGRLGLVVADVSGHGLGPALVMAETRALLRSCVHMHSDLEAILDRLNESLLEDLESGQFVTMLLARLDPRSRTLTYSNAGHPTGYVLAASGEVRFALDSSRIPLGIHSASGPSPDTCVPLERGDIVVLLTDGLLESQDPEGRFFGVEQLLAVLRRHRHEPAQLILEGLFEAVRDFGQGEPQSDDNTAVICKLD